MDSESRRTIHNYPAELGTAVITIAAAYVMYICTSTTSDFQIFVMIACVIFMLIGLIIMFNVAQMRVVAENRWVMLHTEDEDGKE